MASDAAAREGFWRVPHRVPRPVAIVVSCFALLFNMDDLVGASTRLGSHSSSLDLLRVALCVVALGIVCWFPRIGAVLAWIAIPVSIGGANISPIVLVSPLVCVAVTATCTLPFIIINGVVMVAGSIGIAIRWIQWVHTPVPILWTGAFLLSASTALGMALRALLGSRAERRLQDRRIAAIQKQAEQAAEHERQRLAHDMHDYVAHELTVIVAALAAARARRQSHHQDPDQDAALLETVETTSRKALDELRRVLRLLDGQGDPVIGSPVPVSGAPRAEPVETMITDAAQDLEAIGDEVTISISPDAASLIPPEDHRLLLERFLSEAVTNAVKHGGLGSRVTIRASTCSGVLQITLSNTIEKARAGLDVSTGLGIRGLREKAEELHCSVSAQPAPGRDGWIATLSLPEDLAA